jgi:AcrR family transcriptional regulator
MASTRATLVEAATALIDEGGPDAVTLREVGRRAGVSHNAPYKHFNDKEALLAAVATRELTSRAAALEATRAAHAEPGVTVRAALHGYVGWALEWPRRFKLVYGPWSKGTPELDVAATKARASLVGLVAEAQQAGDLPDGDPERLTALLLALAHGAVDLALAGHLAADGKGRAGPDGLVDDLLVHLGGRR